MKQSDARALDELYATLPTIACKGLCARSCRPLMTVRAEAERCDARTQDMPGMSSSSADVVLWDTDRKLRCHKLKAGRCTVYEMRPAICRLWGLVESMPCLWGCKPEPGYLSNEEGFLFLSAIARASQAALSPERAPEEASGPGGCVGEGT